jgi:acyl dehydratase
VFSLERHSVTGTDGPFFDELRVGDVFDTAPAMTLNAGRAAVHQSILGSRLRLSLDDELARRVTGAPVADPSFVWDVAIGQSTLVTRRVVANLFYRGLAFHRLPAIDDTLRTRTEVVGLRQNASRPTGLAALRITTRDQQDRLVLDFWRCAMLPLSHPDVRTGHADALDRVGEAIDAERLADAVEGWDVAAFPTPSEPVPAGASWSLGAGDLVESAPELARLSLNLAHVHHDETSRPGGRLVYGGHTIGLALAQVTRTLPDLLTVVGWHGCDHTGPVRERDTVVSDIEVEAVRPVGPALQAVTLRVLTYAVRDGAKEPVLDWRLVALSR